MAIHTPAKGARPGAPAASSAKGSAGGTPGLGVKPRSFKWFRWLIVFPLLLLGFIYLLGRMVEPIRMRLESIPVVGSPLFGQPVLPILWNPKPDTTNGNQVATEPTGSTPTAPSAEAVALAKLEADVTARLTAAERIESGITRREQDLEHREAAIQSRESSIREQEVRLADVIQETEQRSRELQGQITSDLERVEVIRNMKSSAVVQLFSVLTDEEVLRLLQHMDSVEVARHLSGMDSFRTARLLLQLRQSTSVGTPGN